MPSRSLLRWASDKVDNLVAGGIGAVWKEFEHPRGPDGRFIKKWGMSKKDSHAVGAFVWNGNPKTFPHDQAVGQYAFNQHHANATSTSGKSSWSQERFIRDWNHTNEALRANKHDRESQTYQAMMDQAMRETTEDLITSVALSPEAFGLGPDSMIRRPVAADPGEEPHMLSEVENLTGRLFADRGYLSTAMGTPVTSQSRPILLSIAVPRGTKAAFPGMNAEDRRMVLDHDQELRVTRVEMHPGGAYVYAIATPRTPGRTPEPLDVNPKTAVQDHGAAPAIRHNPNLDILETLNNVRPGDRQSSSGRDLRDKATQLGVDSTGTDQQVKARLLDLKDRETASRAAGNPPNSTRPAPPQPAQQAPVAPTPAAQAPAAGQPQAPGAPAARTEQLARPGTGGGAPSAPAPNAPEPGRNVTGVPAAKEGETAGTADSHTFWDRTWEGWRPPGDPANRKRVTQIQEAMTRGRMTPAQGLRTLESDIEQIREDINDNQGDVAGNLRRRRDADRLDELAERMATGFNLERQRDETPQVPEAPEAAPQPDRERIAAQLEPETPPLRTEDEIRQGIEARRRRPAPAKVTKAAAPAIDPDTPPLRTEEEVRQGIAARRTAANSRTPAERRADLERGQRSDVERGVGLDEDTPRLRTEAEVREGIAARRAELNARTPEQRLADLRAGEAADAERGIGRPDTEAPTVKRPGRKVTPTKATPSAPADAETMEEQRRVAREAGLGELEGDTPMELLRDAPAKKAAPAKAAKAAPSAPAAPSVPAKAAPKPKVEEPPAPAPSRLGTATTLPEARRLAALDALEDAEIPGLKADALASTRRQIREGRTPAATISDMDTAARNWRKQVDRIKASKVGRADDIAHAEGVAKGFDDVAAKLRRSQESDVVSTYRVPKPAKATPAKAVEKAAPPAPEVAPEPPREIPDAPRGGEPLSASRRGDFFHAMTDANFQLPDENSADEFQDTMFRLSEGETSPEDAIREIENQLGFNEDRVRELQQDLRRNPGMEAEMRQEMRQLDRTVSEQRRASVFLRRFFENEPEVTKAEMPLVREAVLPEESKSWLEKAKPEEIREGARQAGLGEVEGDTAEEIFDNARRKIIENERASRAAKKAVPAKRVPKKVVAPEQAPGRAWNNPQAREIAAGLDISDARLAQVQKDLDNPKITPAQAGRNLERSLRVGGPGAQRAYLLGLQGQGEDFRNPSHPLYSPERAKAVDAEGEKLKHEAEQLNQLVERLKKTRRSRMTAPRPQEVKLDAPEKKDAARIAEVTGIPEAEVSERMVDTKENKVPTSEWAKGQGDLLKATTTDAEVDAILKGKTGAELKQISKSLSGSQGSSKADSIKRIKENLETRRFAASVREDLEAKKAQGPQAIDVLGGKLPAVVAPKEPVKATAPPLPTRTPRPPHSPEAEARRNEFRRLRGDVRTHGHTRATSDLMSEAENDYANGQAPAGIANRMRTQARTARGWTGRNKVTMNDTTPMTTQEREARFREDADALDRVADGISPRQGITQEEMDAAGERIEAKKAAAPVKKAATPRATPTFEQLRSASSREEVAAAIEPLTNAELKKLADDGGISYGKNFTKPKMRQAIVQWTVGRRLDGDAITQASPTKPTAREAAAPTKRVARRSKSQAERDARIEQMRAASSPQEAEALLADLTDNDMAYMGRVLEIPEYNKMTRLTLGRNLVQATTGAPTVPTKAAKKAVPRAAFDPDATLARLRDFDDPPSREEGAQLVANASRADLLKMARELSMPGAAKKTMPELRLDIVEATAGRRQDSIATRGFRGLTPGTGDLRSDGTPVKAAKKAAPKGRTVNESEDLRGDPEGDNMRMHGESLTMSLARAYADADRNGSANRLMDIRRRATTRDEQGRLTPQQVVDELRAMREDEQDPLFQRRLDQAIEGIDAPMTPMPDLPEGTPPLARKLMEDLHAIPYARKGDRARNGAGQVRGPSLVDQLAEVYRDVAAQRRPDNGNSPQERIRAIARNKTHEINEAAFRIWDLERLLDVHGGKASPLTTELRQWERGDLGAPTLSTPQASPPSDAPSTPRPKGALTPSQIKAGREQPLSTASAPMKPGGKVGVLGVMSEDLILDVVSASIAQLRKEAADRGVPNTEDMNKTELLKALLGDQYFSMSH